MRLLPGLSRGLPLAQLLDFILAVDVDEHASLSPTVLTTPPTPVVAVASGRHSTPLDGGPLAQTLSTGTHALSPSTLDPTSRCPDPSSTMLFSTAAPGKSKVSVPFLLESFPAPPSHIPTSPLPTSNPPPSLPPSTPLPPLPGPSPIDERETRMLISASRSRRASKISLSSASSSTSLSEPLALMTATINAFPLAVPASPTPSTHTFGPIHSRTHSIVLMAVDDEKMVDDRDYVGNKRLEL